MQLPGDWAGQANEENALSYGSLSAHASLSEGTSDALLTRRDKDPGLAKSAKRFGNAVAVGLPTLVRATLGDRTCYEKTFKVTCLAVWPIFDHPDSLTVYDSPSKLSALLSRDQSCGSGQSPAAVCQEHRQVMDALHWRSEERTCSAGALHHILRPTAPSPGAKPSKAIVLAPMEALVCCRCFKCGCKERSWLRRCWSPTCGSCSS